MNKTQKNGVVENTKGRAKQALGLVTGNKVLESDGALDRAGGAIKKAIGDLKQSIAKRLDK
jgi:uncharacterized protein YjbJ (UPF0337 family)